jgi:hypothetical protein
MRRWTWTQGDLLRALLFIPPAVYATLGLLGLWHSWRDEWVLASWSIAGLAGLVWRGPKALVVPAAATLACAFSLAAGSRTWPEDPALLAGRIAFGAFAFTVIGIAAGLAVAWLSVALRDGPLALLGRRQVLADGATLAILTVALIPVAFGSFGERTTLAVLGLVAAPLAVAGIAAARQPRQCWPLALETWFASLIPQIVSTTWFPIGHVEPLPVVLFESLVAIVPTAWIAALLGKWLGALAVALAPGRAATRRPYQRAREPGPGAAASCSG